MKRARVVLLVLPVLISCSIPLTVRRVSPPGNATVDEVKGVRYRLNRPVTTVALRVPASAKPSDLIPDECGPLELLVEQKMEDAWVYEAEYSPNLLADTDVTFTLGEDGTLTSVSAGETDRILPFVQAVAGVAVSVAKAGRAEDRCPTEVKALLDTQRKLLQREQDVKARAGKLREELVKEGADHAQIEKHLGALASEVERIQGDKGRNKHTLTPQQAIVCVDGRDLVRKEGDDRCGTPGATGEWMRIDLSTQS